MTFTFQELLGNHSCGASRCKTCPILLATDKFSSHATGQHFKIKVNASYKSSNLIYLIMCWRCGQQYVGETEPELHSRINSHWYDIVHKRTKESPVTEPFNGIAHSQGDVRVMVIDQLWNHEPCLRKIRENEWITTWGPRTLSYHSWTYVNPCANHMNIISSGTINYILLLHI